MGRILYRLAACGVLGCVLLVAGCNLWGAFHPHTSDQAMGRLQRGMTKWEVLATAGDPYGRRLRDDGTETWYYAIGCGGWVDLTMAEFDGDGLFVGTWIR